jgi:hypothetical protein
MEKTMSRNFAPISVEELKQKVQKEFYDEHEGYLHDKIRKKFKSDLKVKFDFENFETTDDSFGPKKLMGYRTLSNGLTICGMCAGGDWEHPVFFLMYWDGKKLRAYIPTEGNPWNTKTKEAYGNDDKADLKNARKRWPEAFKDADEESIDSGDFEFEPDLIEKDILERIQPLQPKKVKIKQEAKGLPRDDLRQRIELLTYYGTGHEASELFQQTCSLCYQMDGLGLKEQAKILCGWAEDMAAASAADWAKDGNSLDDKSDVLKGNWGN